MVDTPSSHENTDGLLEPGDAGGVWSLGTSGDVHAPSHISSHCAVPHLSEVLTSLGIGSVEQRTDLEEREVFEGHRGDAVLGDAACCHACINLWF